MKAKKILGLCVLAVVWIIVLFNVPVVKIDSSERGVVSTRWAVQETTLKEGLYVLKPFADKVQKIWITPRTLDVNIPVGAQGSITKDNQTIGTDLTVFYKYKETELVNIKRNYWFDLLLDKIEKDVVESFKQTIGWYTIFDVAQKQEEIRVKFIEAVKVKVWNYPLVVDDIKVSNYDRSEEFDAQIAMTMTIAQESKQQEQQLKKIEISAQQQVVQAEANKQAEALNADAMKLKGQGIKDYNQAITSNPKNMQLEIRLKELEIEKLRVEKRDWKYISQNSYWPIPVSLGSTLWK